MTDSFASPEERAARLIALASIVPDSDLLRQILAPFDVEEMASDEYQHDDLMRIYSKIEEICERYFYERYFYLRSRKVSLVEHRKNLNSVVTSAKKLRAALNQDMLLVSLIMPDFGSSDPIRRRDFDPAFVVDVLRKLEVEAAALLDDDARLRYERRGVDRRWSPERALIWQPYFELLRGRLGRVPASRDGPVSRGVVALHSAIAAHHELSLPELSIEALYDAIRDFNAEGAES